MALLETAVNAAPRPSVQVAHTILVAPAHSTRLSLQLGTYIAESTR